MKKFLVQSVFILALCVSSIHCMQAPSDEHQELISNMARLDPQSMNEDIGYNNMPMINKDKPQYSIAKKNRPVHIIEDPDIWVDSGASPLEKQISAQYESVTAMGLTRELVDELKKLPNLKSLRIDSYATYGPVTEDPFLYLFKRENFPPHLTKLDGISIPFEYLGKDEGVISEKLQEISVYGFNSFLSQRFQNLKKLTVKLEEPESAASFMNSINSFKHLGQVRVSVNDVETLKIIDSSLPARMKAEYCVKLLREKNLTPEIAQKIVGIEDTHIFGNEKLLEVIEWSRGSIKEIPFRGPWMDILTAASELPQSVTKLDFLPYNQLTTLTPYLMARIATIFNRLNNLQFFRMSATNDNIQAFFVTQVPPGAEVHIEWSGLAVHTQRVSPYFTRVNQESSQF